MSTTDTVPAAEYARVKTHLYGRIDTLRARAERAERALATLADIHHRTKVGSKLHDPEQCVWQDCICRTCASVQQVLSGTEAERQDGAEELEMLSDAD